MPFKLKLCIDCGRPFLPKSNSQKYCKLCALHNRRELGRLRQQKYRKRWEWHDKNHKGSKNSNLGSKAIEDKEEELEKVHKEKVKILGSTEKYLSKSYCVTPVIESNVNTEKSV